MDSADPSADNTSSKNNSGPLNYTLPNGATVIGAHVSLEDNILYLLAVNNGTCQLYSANTSSSGSASISPVDASRHLRAGAGHRRLRLPQRHRQRHRHRRLPGGQRQ